jgi:O-antigen chain-terminating methyltransferase
VDPEPDPPAGRDPAAIEELRERLDAEDGAYAGVLAALDRLAAFELPSERAPLVRERLERLNALWSAAPAPAPGGLAGALRRRVFSVVAPALERQVEFNAALVQLLNERLAEQDRLEAHLRELAAALVHYAQRVLPLVDARDRMASALATTRAELVLDSFARRLEDLAGQTREFRAGLDAARQQLEAARRELGSSAGDVERLLAQRDRLEAVSEEVRAIRGTLAAAATTPEVARSAIRAAEESVYTAFENRFRGSREELRKRQAPDAALFRGLDPVADLGCGRGEFLELLREAGVSGRGVDSNANAVLECREKGFDVVQADLVGFLRAHEAGALGGVYAAQVVEHLPPPVLAAMLAEAHRVLRKGGLLLLETVNARTAMAFLEVYIRDLTHERPLHSETLAFMVAAHGFTDVRVETRSPLPAEGRLKPVPWQDLPPAAVREMNENFERLNVLLYGPLDYAVIARR